MKGILLKAYCALAKTYCLLDISRCEYNKQKIDELIEKVKAIQKEIYELSSEEMVNKLLRGEE